MGGLESDGNDIEFTKIDDTATDAADDGDLNDI